MRPDAVTLAVWQRRWSAIRAAAYRDLVATYTEEQRAIIVRVNEAARNEKLCKARLRSPDGYSGLRHVAWPEEPPISNYVE